MKKVVINLLVVFGLTATTCQIFAASISIQPNSLSFYLKINSQATKTLTINNFANVPQIYNLSSDELSEIITINPAIFRLEPGENIKVSITVAPSTAGIWATNISVIAQEIDRKKFNAAAGVKIPVEIVALAPALSFFQKNFIWFIIMLSLLIMAFDIYIILRRRKKLTWWQKIIQRLNLLHHHRK